MDNELYKDRLTWFTVIWALVCPIKFLLPNVLWTPPDTANDRVARLTVIRALLSPIKLIMSDDEPWIWACIMVISGIALAICWWYYFRAPESTETMSAE